MIKEMNIQQAAAFTGYHEATLTRACQQGRIKARRAGKRWIVDTASLIEFGKRKPFKAPRCGIQENRLKFEEIPENRLKFEEIPEIAPEPEEKPKDWMMVPIASYEDLLLQYRRGFADGYNQARIESLITKEGDQNDAQG